MKIRECVAMVGLLAFSGKSDPGVTLCNETTRPVVYAIVQQTSIFYPLSEHWVAAGWYKIEAGKCRDPSVRSMKGGEKMYLSLLTDYGGKLVINHYKLPITDANGDVYWGESAHESGAELFFCVKEGGFKREEETLSDHERCPGDYFPQLFNFFAGTMNESVNLKVRIK